MQKINLVPREPIQVVVCAFSYQNKLCSSDERMITKATKPKKDLNMVAELGIMALTLKSTTSMQIVTILTIIPTIGSLLKLHNIIFELFNILNLKCICFKFKGIGSFIIDVFIFP